MCPTPPKPGIYPTMAALWLIVCAIVQLFATAYIFINDVATLVHNRIIGFMVLNIDIM